MNKLYFALVAASALIAGTASAQGHPVVDKLATKVIQKYQSSSCEQLAMKRAAPPSDDHKKAIEALREHPELRTEFIDRVAAPIANKLFECGLIP